jgi:hypothetical protein
MELVESAGRHPGESITYTYASTALVPAFDLHEMDFFYFSPFLINISEMNMGKTFFKSSIFHSRQDATNKRVTTCALA